MFTSTQTNGRHPQTDTDGQPSLADIIREETDGGRLIIRFLVDAMRGDIDHVKPCHRLDAARQLLEHGYSDARRLIDDNTLQSTRRAPSPAAAAQSSSAPDDELADIVRQETDGGRDAVRFLVDVMKGDLAGFKPRHRLAAAKELLLRLETPGRGDRNDRDSDIYRPHAAPPPKIELPEKNLPEIHIDEYRRQDDEDFNFDSYTDYDYVRDSHGSLALDHIFDGPNGRLVATHAVSNYGRAKEKALSDGVEYHHPADLPRQPGDDPYGVDSYGYTALLYIYGTVEEVRVANMAAEKYHNRTGGSLALSQPGRARDPRPPPRRTLIWV